MSIPEDQVGALLADVSAEFSQRHQEICRVFLERNRPRCSIPRLCRTPINPA
jgi:hypothetical protein